MNCIIGLKSFDKKINRKSNLNTDIPKVSITTLIESLLMMKAGVTINKWKISMHSTTEKHSHQAKIFGANVNKDHIATVITSIS